MFLFLNRLLRINLFKIFIKISNIKILIKRFENGEIKSLGVANFSGRENKYIFS